MEINDFRKICLSNKYTNWYFSIIHKAKLRNWNKKTSPSYVEGHHIIPKSIYKNKNIVYLTAKEHFICHLLLTKMLEGENKRKMVSALICMKMKHLYSESRYINSSLYDSVRKQYSEYKKQQWNDPIYRKNITDKVSSNRPNMSGKNNPMFGRKGKLSPFFNKPKSSEHKEKIKNALLGKKHSDKRKLKMSENSPKNSLGKKWYHNPITNEQKYYFEGTQPDGFIIGRK
jgi:hypothetical protein